MRDDTGSADARLLILQWMMDAAWRFNVLLLSVAVVALAHPVRADLAWQAPPECPRAEQVSGEIDRLLAGSEYPEGALNEFALTVTHDTRAGVFVMRITRSPSGGARQERVVEAADCGELVQAAALAVALAIDPELQPREATPPAASAPATPATASQVATTPAAAGAAPPPSPSPAPQPQPATATKVAPPPRSAAPTPAPAGSATPVTGVTPEVPLSPTQDQPAPSEPLSEATPGNPRISAFALITGDTGSLPEAALGVGGGAAAVLGEATRLQLALEFFAPTETEPDPSGAYARFGLYRAHLSGCYSPFVDRILLFGCAALQAGGLWAQGRGVADTHELNRAWLAAGADLLVLGRLADRTSLQLRAGLARPLIERQYVMNGASVHQVSSWVFDAALGVEFRFN